MTSTCVCRGRTHLLCSPKDRWARVRVLPSAADALAPWLPPGLYWTRPEWDTCGAPKPATPEAMAARRAWLVAHPMTPALAARYTGAIPAKPTPKPRQAQAAPPCACRGRAHLVCLQAPTWRVRSSRRGSVLI